MLDAAAPHLAAAERERYQQAVRLLSEALHLAQHGERAPGGNETWAELWHKTETFLRQEAPGAP
jgi:hypothetical protein